MRNRPFIKQPDFWVPAIIYAVIGLVLWQLPLLEILHAESAAVIAFSSFFVAGLAALHRFNRFGLAQQHIAQQGHASSRGFGKARWWKFYSGRSHPFVQTLAMQLTLLAIPWLMLTVSLLWQENCSYGQGFLFYILFTMPSVCLAVAGAYLVAQSSRKRKKLVFVVAGILVALGGVVFDIGFHPQFFTYSHIFGGVLGPIYDEELFIRMGLLFAKGRTLLLALGCWIAGEVLRTRQPGRFVRPGAALLLVLVLSYVFAAQLRINTPAWFIRAQLEGHITTTHFDIYYSPAVTDSIGAARLAAEHEYRYQFIQQKLGIDVQDRIQSYIYPDAETKDWLTGARNTSVAPVWLAQPQMHIVADIFDVVFPHELGHVFSREFGLPVLNASLSVGLVEGLAVALEPADGRPTPHEQVLTAVTLNTPAGDTLDIDGGIGLASRLSPLGFWTGRGSVSYTTMGSFVAYLAETYGYEQVMAAYARSNFEAVFGAPVEQLAADWAAYLQELPYVDRSTHNYVTRRFSIPSLFEKTCPHHLPAHERSFRAGSNALVAGDTLAALAGFEEAMNLLPGFESATQAWASIKINQQQPAVVIDRIERDLLEAVPARPVSAGIHVQYGDALALHGMTEQALAAFDSAQVRLPAYAHQQRGLVTLRKILAPNLEVQRINRSLLLPQQKVDALAIHVDASPEVYLLQGLLLLSDAPAAALTYLQKYKAQEQSVQARDVRVLTDMLLTQLHYINSDHEAAAVQAETLAAQFSENGALNTASVYTDFARKMRYIILHEEEHGFVLN